ncbi:hypothetical protein R84B8_02707 [Treponema sp. R8-4-B8]
MAIFMLVLSLAFTACGNMNENDDKLIIPTDLGKMDQEGSGWRKLLSKIEDKKEMVSLDLSACAMDGTEFNPDNTVSTGKSYIDSIILPNVAESIRDGNFISAFKYFDNLKTVHSNTLTRIGNSAFYGCNSLTSVNFSAVKNIGSHSFRNCTSITSVDLPEVQRIPAYAFEYCPNLTRVNIPEVTNIDNYAFYQCDALSEITVKGGVLTDNAIDLTNQSDVFKEFHEYYLENTQTGRVENYIYIQGIGWTLQ